jgi:hypothetical protein
MRVLFPQIFCRFDFLVGVARRVLEVPDGLPDPAYELGQFAPSEQYQNDEHDNDKLLCSQAEHDLLPLVKSAKADFI